MGLGLHAGGKQERVRQEKKRKKNGERDQRGRKKGTSPGVKGLFLPTNGMDKMDKGSKGPVTKSAIKRWG